MDCGGRGELQEPVGGRSLRPRPPALPQAPRSRRTPPPVPLLRLAVVSNRTARSFRRGDPGNPERGAGLLSARPAIRSSGRITAEVCSRHGDGSFQGQRGSMVPLAVVSR